MSTLFITFAIFVIPVPSGNRVKDEGRTKSVRKHREVVLDKENTESRFILPSECLSLRLGSEEYGIDILKVQEIRGYETVTHIANAPLSIRGVINLRGVIVPIIDLRIALNVSDVIYDGMTAVIVLNLGKHTVGVVVDGVSDVVTLLPEQVRPAPELGAGHAADYITGIAMLAERTLILVDIAAMLANVGLDFSQPIAA